MPVLPSPLPHLLIIDDDANLLESYTVLLEDDFHIHTATTGEAGLACLQREAMDLLLLDVRLPTMDGLEVLRRVKVLDAQLPVVIISACNEAHAAAEAFKLGVVDYLVKPFDADATLHRLRGAVAPPHGAQPPLVAPATTTVPRVLGTLVGQSAPMQALATLISRVADTTAPVLLLGESGVGKEQVARALHQQSPRRARPFVPINGGAVPPALAASLFFGHERGAFTGAVQRQVGAFERAQGGTLFLDELDSLPLPTQALLLRVLQEQAFERVGGRALLHADVRLVAAAAEDLARRVEAGTFRADLFYRLHVVPVRVPPLRERPADLPLLVQHFLAHYNQAYGRQVPGLTVAALTCLSRYGWPGNVRELEHLIARLVASSRPRVLDVDDLPPEIRADS